MCMTGRDKKRLTCNDDDSSDLVVRESRTAEERDEMVADMSGSSIVVENSGEDGLQI